MMIKRYIFKLIFFIFFTVIFNIKVNILHSQETKPNAINILYYDIKKNILIDSNTNEIKIYINYYGNEPITTDAQKFQRSNELGLEKAYLDMYFSDDRANSFFVEGKINFDSTGINLGKTENEYKWISYITFDVEIKIQENCHIIGTLTKYPKGTSTSAMDCSKRIKDNEKFKNDSIKISSVPNNAKIFINNYDTGLFTPSQVLINNSGAVKIKLKKRDFWVFEKTEHFKKDSTYQYVMLKKPWYLKQRYLVLEFSLISSAIIMKLLWPKPNERKQDLINPPFLPGKREN